MLDYILQRTLSYFLWAKKLWSLEIVHCLCLNRLQFFPASAPDYTKNIGTMTRWTRDKESAGKIFLSAFLGMSRGSLAPDQGVLLE